MDQSTKILISQLQQAAWKLRDAQLALVGVPDTVCSLGNDIKAMQVKIYSALDKIWSTESPV